MKDVNVEASTSKTTVGLDSDNDGKNSVTLRIYNLEAFSEVFSRSDAKEGQGTFSYKVVDGVIKLELDTDKDSEPSVGLDIDVIESLDEGMDRL